MNVDLQFDLSSALRLSLPGIAELAIRALRDEAALTPKPGLVDRRGPGAHHDMTAALLQRSADAMAPGLHAMVRASAGQPVSVSLRETLGNIGRKTEVAMLMTTGGINTHRGALWALGLLSSAAAMSPQPFHPRCITATAAALARLPDRFAPTAATHGSEVARRFGGTGARGEAAAGFPHVLRYGLPTLHAVRAQGATEDQARLDALLAIMAHLQDTCLLHRGGMEALWIVQASSADILAAGGAAAAEGRRRLQALDRTLLQLWVSPGGSADLLAATLFLDSLQAATPVGGPSIAEAKRADLGL